jgi:hypothetical protein
MYRRIGRDDFRQANESQKGALRESDAWSVCSEYELEEDPEYGGEMWEPEYRPYLIKPKSAFAQGGDEIRWRRYRPLEETHLFLEFARLYDKGFSVERIVDWVHRYGTLNFSRFSRYSPHSLKHANTVRAFWGEVCWAAGVLGMYEAVLNGDASEAQRLAQNDFYFLASEDEAQVWMGGAAIDRRESESRLNRSPLWKRFGDEAEDVAKMVEDRFFGDYLAYALHVAVWAVDDVVQKHCFPTLLLPGPFNSDTSRVTGGWGFDNLLGAMYMQMRWLMASGAALKRCLFCGRIISLAPPSPGARKPRSDKEYCNKSCRQNASNRRKRD